MKKICYACGCAAVLLTAAPIRSYAAGIPETGAKAFVLMDAQTGQIVCGRNENQKLPMASTTKIMTTLLTIESGGLDEPFTADSDAIRVEGSSMGLQEGDTVTKRALCAGMLLPSGNDAANAAAIAVAGSIPAFLDMMNDRAQELGLSRTCFASPSGLDADGHGSSARDMALLTRAALQNELFAEICKSPRMTVEFGNPPYARTLKNTNKLLQMGEGILGVKTGYTDAAGRCLVSACEREGRRLICVTLNDRNDWDDHLSLYDWGFSEAAPYSPALPETLTVPLEGGTTDSLRVYAKQPLTVTAWHGVPPVLEETVLLPPFVTAPVSKGDIIGELVYTSCHIEAARLPLVAAEDAPAAAQKQAKSSILFRVFQWFREL